MIVARQPEREEQANALRKGKCGIEKKLNSAKTCDTGAGSQRTIHGMKGTSI
jgi:hypothetical protein